MFDAELIAAVLGSVLVAAIVGGAAPDCLPSRRVGTSEQAGLHHAAVLPVRTLLRIACSLACAFAACVTAAATFPHGNGPLQQLPLVAAVTAVAFVVAAIAARVGRAPLEAALADAFVSSDAGGGVKGA